MMKPQCVRFKKEVQTKQFINIFQWGRQTDRGAVWSLDVKWFKMCLLVV